MNRLVDYIQHQYPDCNSILQFYKMISLGETGYQVKGTQDLSVLLITTAWESTIILTKTSI